LHAQSALTLVAVQAICLIYHLSMPWLHQQTKSRKAGQYSQQKLSKDLYLLEVSGNINQFFPRSRTSVQNINGYR